MDEEEALNILGKSSAEVWWPESGSCREDCPHEIAKRKRDKDRERHIEEMRNDPEVTAAIEEFQANMDVLKEGGPEAEALKQKWKDDDFDAGIRLVWRATDNWNNEKKRADALEARLAELDAKFESEIL